MVRVWCEYVPADTLAEPSTLDLLAREGVHPLVAVRRNSDFATLSRALHGCRNRGLEPGVWPLLDVDDGYWPSERTIDDWANHLGEILDRFRQHDAIPDWVAVDLEPPFGQAAHLLRSPRHIPFAAAELAIENMDIVRYRRSERRLNEVVRDLRGRGIGALGVTLPLAAHDLGEASRPVWQDMFETPWAGVEWDAAGIMAYGSVISGASGGMLSPADVRALHQPLLERVSRCFGRASHASIGITGTGVFGDEPCWDDPEELRLDAAAARAAGVADLAVFCLGGILDRASPEVWLRAVTRARPIVPPRTWRSDGCRLGGRLLRGVAVRLFGR